MNLLSSRCLARISLISKSKIGRVSDRACFLVRFFLALFLVGIMFPIQNGWAYQTASDKTKLNTETAEQRWFEVEVILYKANSDAGLNNESWSVNTPLEIPSEVVDFLQPFSESEQDSSNDIDLISQDLSLGTKKQTPDLSIGLEKPFLLLNEKEFQLTEEANRIARNRNYTLVAHFSWRQPVFGRKNSRPVRVAGGFNFQETFDYSGSKKIDPAYLELRQGLESQYAIDQERDQDYIKPPTPSPNTPEANLQIPSNDNLAPNQANLLSVGQKQNGSNVPESNISGSNTPKSNIPKSSTPTEAKFVSVPLPWVPEVDGSLFVYIQRNYLHIDAKLFYRLPLKEEVSALDLTNSVISFDGGLSGFSDPVEEDDTIMPQSELITANVGETPTPTPTSASASALNWSVPKSNPNDHLIWRLDDDFLAKKVEKFYITRLINYPLEQTRRLRSGVLQYFDHPLIGMLVVIRPYQRELISPTRQSDDIISSPVDLNSSVLDRPGVNDAKRDNSVLDVTNPINQSNAPNALGKSSG